MEEQSKNLDSASEEMTSAFNIPEMKEIGIRNTKEHRTKKRNAIVHENPNNQQYVLDQNIEDIFDEIK